MQIVGETIGAVEVKVLTNQTHKPFTMSTKVDDKSIEHHEYLHLKSEALPLIDNI